MPILTRAAASRWVVITDLDGTLLDHDSYSLEPALPALARLAESGTALVLATSKTRAELGGIQRQLALGGPVIAENGALLALPAGWSGDAETLQRFSPPYPELLTLLGDLRRSHGFRFQGFHDLGPQEVAALTGLTPEAAEAACAREGSEPIRWQGSHESFEQFAARLAEHDLKLLRGGRFHHVIGAGADKARALHAVLAALRAHGWRGRSIVLGDAPNDHGMLCAADIPVIVRNPHAAPMPPIENPHLIRTASAGPAGWREAIEAILEDPREKFS